MQFAHTMHDRSPIRFRKRQQGQALVYGIFVMVVGLTALFFLFNTGQLTSEKTKLVNTADAVAYSAAVFHARALNFDAYNNRALVANEVLVAQMVSLSSWGQYAKTHVENMPIEFPECYVPVDLAVEVDVVLAIDMLMKVSAKYGLMCLLVAQKAGPMIDRITSQIPAVTQQVVNAVEINKGAIKAAQLFLHAPLIFERMRGELMQQVADKNYDGDGIVTVQPNNLLAGLGVNTMTDDWKDFTKRYSGTDRRRLAQVVAPAASTDDFVQSRGYDAVAPYLPLTEPICSLEKRRNSVRRRGGTELISLDEWKAEDTESYWEVYDKHSGVLRLRIRCKDREHPIAWGEQRAFPKGKENRNAKPFLGGSPTTNPLAHGMASSKAWTNYTGLPSFYDLSPSRLADPDPRLKFAVRIVRNAANVRTSDGASQIRPGASVNGFSTQLAGGVMSAISTGEVYFDRPWFNNGDNTGQGETFYKDTRNQYAVAIGSQRTRELGSLFNPYWQVRLAPNDELRTVLPKQLEQAAGLP